MIPETTPMMTSSAWNSRLVRHLSTLLFSAYPVYITQLHQPTTLSHRAGTCAEPDWVSSTHPGVRPPIRAINSSKSPSPLLTPCPPVSERGPATVAPAHTRTALACLGIKIACDLTASLSTALGSALYPASSSTHMTRSVRGLPYSEFQRQVMM